MLRIVGVLEIGRRYGFSINRFSKHPVCYHGVCGDSCPHAHRLHFALETAFPCLRCHCRSLMFLTSLSLLTGRPATGWRAVARRSSCTSISIPNRWRGFLRLQVITARCLSLLATHWGCCNRSRQIGPRARALQADCCSWLGGKAGYSREQGATWQEHGLKRGVSSCSAWISMPRAHSAGSSARMQSYGLGTMPYLDWFCSVEGDPLPRTLSGLHLGLGKGGVSFSPKYGML